MKTISEIEKEYEIELEKIVKKIKSIKKKNPKILLQFPDGLKPYATQITDYLEKQTNAQISVWLGSCFGACDIPKVDDIDLLIQFGHSEWKY